MAQLRPLSGRAALLVDGPVRQNNSENFTLCDPTVRDRSFSDYRYTLWMSAQESNLKKLNFPLDFAQSNNVCNVFKMYKH